MPGDIGVETRFKPGKSGNPGGKPKIPAEVKELFRELTLRAVAALSLAMRAAAEPGACAADRGVAVKAADIIRNRAGQWSGMHI